MHGKVFVIANEKSIKDGAFCCRYDESQMRDTIYCCDYVVAEDKSEFESSICWLNSIFRADVCMRQVASDRGKIFVGVIEQADIWSIQKELVSMKKRRIEEARRELEKADPDLWLVAYRIYNDNTFYFFDVEGAGLCDEIEAATYMESWEPPLYITQTYDYHR